MSKKDLLEQCMDSSPIQASIEDFQTAYCSLCVNPECVRSQWSISKWALRMERQENALNEPKILTPQGNEHFMRLANQGFVSLETLEHEAKVYSGWDVPEPSEKKKVIHHAEPETESKSADKVSKTLSVLKQEGSGGLVEVDSNNVVEEEPQLPSPESDTQAQDIITEQLELDAELEVEEPSKLKSEPEPFIIKPNPNNPSQKKSGIYVGGSGGSGNQISKPNPIGDSKILTKQDKWSVPTETRGKDGKLIVRINDGKIIKK